MEQFERKVCLNGLKWMQCVQVVSLAVAVLTMIHEQASLDTTAISLLTCKAIAWIL